MKSESAATSSRSVSRRIDLGGRALLVIDHAFRDADISSLYTLLRQSPYRLNDKDSDEYEHVFHWRADFPVAMAQQAPLLRDCVTLTHELMQPAVLKLDAVHANLELYGDILFPHFDHDNGVTCVYYANPVWEKDWQGETVFCDERGEPVHVVAPKPGRIVIFDGGIVHRAGVPSRDCYTPRITLAFNFVRV